MVLKFLPPSSLPPPPPPLLLLLLLLLPLLVCLFLVISVPCVSLLTGVVCCQHDVTPRSHKTDK